MQRKQRIETSYITGFLKLLSEQTIDFGVRHVTICMWWSKENKNIVWLVIEKRIESKYEMKEKDWIKLRQAKLAKEWT